MEKKLLSNVTLEKNGFNQMVKCCCASCRNREIDFDGTRVCRLLQLKVAASFGCCMWKINEQCERAGMWRGRVKSKAYLMYVQAVRTEENEAIEAGQMTERDRLSTEQLEETFVKQFGSIWVIR